MEEYQRRVAKWKVKKLIGGIERGREGGRAGRGGSGGGVAEQEKAVEVEEVEGEVDEILHASGRPTRSSLKFTVL